jgi:hypothetical protein
VLVEGDPPPPHFTAHALGLPMTPEVTAIRVTRPRRSPRPAACAARVG